MKKTILSALAISIAAAASAQSKADYDQAMSRVQQYLNKQQADSLFSMFAEKIKTMMPEDKTRQVVSQLHTNFGDMKSYELSKTKDDLYFYKSEFAKGTFTTLVGLNADKKLETFRILPYTPEKKEKSNLVLKTAEGNIYGTLVVPEGETKMPVVLIIAGSGPTDRDGNSSMFGLAGNMYKTLADSLQKAGIAAARYDKRGVGESNEVHKSGFEEEVEDAAGLLKMLKEDPRFSKVIVLGHSEGSLTGMLAIEKVGAAGFISVAGAGERIDKIMEWQFGIQSKETAKKATVVLDSLKKGHKVTHVDSTLGLYFSPQNQSYMIAWLKYDPAQEIKKLKMPVLIVNGTTDIQVQVKQAEMLAKAKPAAKLKLIPGMNHVLKSAPADREANIATYANPNLPLSPGLMPELVKFIKGL